ncbi:hypothetical protein RHGRI_018850 [Rhododendron griersonianum]|uniref:Uncharacterized protein n=1 Tax=Rhododendron griersonianum TaxID=479676 RepID=A0AAV6K339_9ERIC|nr:hypothetical protein RHGRI_018850 [Rhododendron griersonianum]
MASSGYLYVLTFALLCIASTERCDAARHLLATPTTIQVEAIKSLPKGPKLPRFPKYKFTFPATPSFPTIPTIPFSPPSKK